MNITFFPVKTIINVNITSYFDMFRGYFQNYKKKYTERVSNFSKQVEVQ